LDQITPKVYIFRLYLKISYSTFVVLGGLVVTVLAIGPKILEF